MKKSTNWKLFAGLLAACVITSLMVLPYTLALSPAIAALFSPIVLIAQVVQASIIFAIAIFLGLKLSKKAGFESPVLAGKKPYSYLRENLGWSAGLGVLGGLLIILFSFLFSDLSLEFLRAEMRVETWKGLLASFYGGIAEEVVFRLFLMSLFVWVSMKFTRTKDGMPTDRGVWASIIVSTIIFGLGHLGITGGITTITPLVVMRAILLNGVSVIFGWLYWKKGLEAAMIAHFSADIVVHVIVPMIARMLI